MLYLFIGDVIFYQVKLLVSYSVLTTKLTFGYFQLHTHMCVCVGGHARIDWIGLRIVTFN